MRYGRASAAGLIVAVLLWVGTSRAADPSGDWLIEAGDTRIRVDRCGSALCGEIVWLKQATDASGQPQRDDKNPDPAKQQRPLVGLRIFEMQPKGETWSGPIYNSDDGNTYEGTITPQGADKLEVRACAGDNCGAEIWTRQ